MSVDQSGLPPESHSAPPPLNNRLLTVREAASELRCSESFVYKLLRTGQIAYERRGRRKLPTFASVCDYRLRNSIPALEQEPFRPAEPSRLPYQFKHLYQKKRPRSTGSADS